MTQAPPAMELVTIAVSHYNERARWALDRYGVEYRERGYMPMFHMPAVLWATRGRPGQADRVSSPLSTPLLVTDEGERIHDSGQIVQWVCRTYADETDTLYPAALRDDIVEFEQFVHDEIGPHTRRIAYWFLSQDSSLMYWMADRNVGRAQATAFRGSWFLLSKLVFRALRITEPQALRSMDKLRARLAELEDRLRDRAFLFGDRFTAADLSLACMLAPAILPSPTEGYGATLPDLDRMGDEAAGFIGEVRRTAAGRHALRMFAEQRGRVGPKA